MTRTKTFLLLSMVSLNTLVQGKRVNKAQSKLVAVQSHSETLRDIVATSQVKFAFANQNRSGCNYQAPGAVAAAEKGGLSDKDFAALDADPNIVAYAYGPGLIGENQILAWSYLPKGNKGYLWGFFPKSSAETKGQCENERLRVTSSGKSSCVNTPGVLGCAICPSCSIGWRGCGYESKSFAVNSWVEIGEIMTAQLVDTGSKTFRFADKDGQTMPKQIYLCSFSKTGSAETAFPPVETAVTAPEEAPVETPVVKPVETPVEAPVETPVKIPEETPAEMLLQWMHQWEEMPVDAPVEMPVETPEEETFFDALEAPDEAPVEMPVEAPAETPVETPEKTPVEKPAATPESPRTPGNADEDSAARRTGGTCALAMLTLLLYRLSA